MLPAALGGALARTFLTTSRIASSGAGQVHWTSFCRTKAIMGFCGESCRYESQDDL